MQANIQNGIVNLTPESYWENKMVVAAAERYAERKADQEALTKIYKVGPELQRRIGIGRNKQYEEINSGRLRATVAGEKKYLVSELACREYLGDVKPVSFTEGNQLKAAG